VLLAPALVLVELGDLALECLGNGVLLPGVAAEPNEREETTLNERIEDFALGESILMEFRRFEARSTTLPSKPTRHRERCKHLRSNAEGAMGYWKM
jgi:hypothetical protein